MRHLRVCGNAPWVHGVPYRLGRRRDCPIQARKPVFYRVKAFARIANDDPGGASYHQVHTQSEIFDDIAPIAIGGCRVTANGDAVDHCAAVVRITPDRLTQCNGESNLERRAAIRFARTAKIVEIGHDDVGRADQVHVGPAYPLRLVQ